MKYNVEEFPQQQTETHEPDRESLLMQPDPQTMEKVRDIYERVKTKREERKALNQEITAILTELESLGVDKQAAKHVWKYLELEEEQRRLYDLSASLIRKAQGVGLQGDLFEEKQIDATREKIVGR